MLSNFASVNLWIFLVFSWNYQLFSLVWHKAIPGLPVGITLCIIHFPPRRVPEADGITDEDTAARQLRFSGGIGRHAHAAALSSGTRSLQRNVKRRRLPQSDSTPLLAPSRASWALRLCTMAPAALWAMVSSSADPVTPTA